MDIPLNLKWGLFNALNEKLIKNEIVNELYSEYKKNFLS